MNFISKVTDITGTEFVSLKELRISGYDIDRLALFQPYEIRYINPVFIPQPDNLISDGYFQLQKEALKPFINSCGTDWVKADPAFEIIDPFVIVRNCSGFEERLTYQIFYHIYTAEKLKSLHPTARERFFTIPMELNDQHGLSDQKVYYRISDTFSKEPPPATAQQKRKDGQMKAIQSGMAETVQAGILVGEWIEASAFSRGEVTKAKVQDFLYENGFKGDKVSQAVWKSIPVHQRNSSGRPPK